MPEDIEAMAAGIPEDPNAPVGGYGKPQPAADITTYIQELADEYGYELSASEDDYELRKQDDPFSHIMQIHIDPETTRTRMEFFYEIDGKKYIDGGGGGETLRNEQEITEYIAKIRHILDDTAKQMESPHGEMPRKLLSHYRNELYDWRITVPGNIFLNKNWEVELNDNINISGYDTQIIIHYTQHGDIDPEEEYPELPRHTVEIPMQGDPIQSVVNAVDTIRTNPEYQHDPKGPRPSVLI